MILGLEGEMEEGGGGFPFGLPEMKGKVAAILQNRLALVTKGGGGVELGLGARVE